MAETEIETRGHIEGQLLALAVVGASVLAKLALDDQDLLPRLHEALTGQIQESLERRISVSKSALERTLVASMSRGGTESLDRVFQVADGLRRGALRED